MIRQVIKIDESKCNGCGLCARACHEVAIDIVNGKAKLVRENFCDGFGDCLPNCPQHAITFESRDVPKYDEEAVKKAKALKLEKSKANNNQNTELTMWPIQIKLSPLQAPYFANSKLLIAASCTAFSYASFHKDFIKDHVVLIGCPKLDTVDYSEKLYEIIDNNDIKEISVVRMEVPCCSGLLEAVKKAVALTGKGLKITDTIIGKDGRIL